MVPTPLAFGDRAPIGSVIAYAGIIDESQKENTTGTINNIEAYGWVICDGRSLECNKFPQLFQAIGFLYTKTSPNDLSNMPKDQKFQVPDYRGYFLRGDATGTTNDPDMDERKFVDGSTVSSQGSKTGSIQSDAFQSHKHNYSDASATTLAGKGSDSTAIATAKTTPTSTPIDAIDSPTGNKAARFKAETRPKNMYVNYLVKAIS